MQFNAPFPRTLTLSLGGGKLALTGGAGSKQNRGVKASGHVLILFLVVSSVGGAIRDTPFLQSAAVRITSESGLNGAVFERLAVNRDGVVYVLTDRGVARVFDRQLVLDKSYRPLIGKKPVDLIEREGRIYYLSSDEFLSNDSAGKPLASLPEGRFRLMLVLDSGTVVLAGAGGAALLKENQINPIELPAEAGVEKLFSDGNECYAVAEGGSKIIRIRPGAQEVFHEGTGIRALAFRNGEMIVGTTEGYYVLELRTGGKKGARETRLPAVEITCLRARADGLWVGTTRGVFRRGWEGGIRYYASRRWLLDDGVVDLEFDPKGDLWVLSRRGLNKIEFRVMTLAEKAEFYDEKIRQRHVRFGFCSELYLRSAGDITSAEMIDTDNDGTWSNYYMASQAFRFGATGSEEARRNVWETFEALERLETINGLDGFPSRSFERRGFKVSDPERWHPTADGHWEWKAHTSSDEITAHAFGCAVLYETTARTAAEKERIKVFFTKVMDHILRNNYYLVDVDGKPTLWGRWNPEYVNWFPHTIGDRRLNSAEIIAMLQLAGAISGRAIYEQKARELMDRHGYLENIKSSLRKIAPTPGYIHQGNDMGNEWNHSDDLLGFVTYWVLHRYAFDDALRRTYQEAIRDHWEIERVERCPLWNFVVAAAGISDCDLEGAAWTLRYFPLDMVDWSVANSHRRDITRLSPNFRGQQLAELLPPDERRITRWNSQPFVLDGGNGGHTELAGDEFLLPYWMGRYLKLIE